MSGIYEFFFGGTRGFNDAEAKLLSLLGDALPARDQEVLSQQINLVRKVQRQHQERLVVVYYRKNVALPKLPYPGDAYCLATITYRSEGRAKKTSLVLHDGRFMTFERNVPRKLSEIGEPISVVLHPNRFKSVAPEIDAEEHGEPIG